MRKIKEEIIAYNRLVQEYAMLLNLSPETVKQFLRFYAQIGCVSCVWSIPLNNCVEQAKDWREIWFRRGCQLSISSIDECKFYEPFTLLSKKEEKA
ncbi:MAG: hypothetical protein ACK415_11765 [Thermodesulfovibrionales bacterium]